MAAPQKQTGKTDQELNPENYFNSPVGHIRDRIIINQNSKLPAEGQFISLNGFPFLAKAGVEIDIPRPVRLMLDTRIETEILRVDDGKGHVDIYEKDIPRITYSIVKLGVNLPENEAEATKEEVF
jgi:hypothetical protein